MNQIDQGHIPFVVVIMNDKTLFSEFIWPLTPKVSGTWGVNIFLSKHYSQYIMKPKQLYVLQAFLTTG